MKCFYEFLRFLRLGQSFLRNVIFFFKWKLILTQKEDLSDEMFTFDGTHVVWCVRNPRLYVPSVYLLQHHDRQDLTDAATSSSSSSSSRHSVLTCQTWRCVSRHSFLFIFVPIRGCWNQQPMCMTAYMIRGNSTRNFLTTPRLNKRIITLSFNSVRCHRKTSTLWREVATLRKMFN
jgi:hypothetical protein